MVSEKQLITAWFFVFHLDHYFPKTNIMSSRRIAAFHISSSPFSQREIYILALRPDSRKKGAGNGLPFIFCSFTTRDVHDDGNEDTEQKKSEKT